MNILRSRANLIKDMILQISLQKYLMSKDIHKSEVVTCLGTFHIFPQPEDLLNAVGHG